MRACGLDMDGGDGSSGYRVSKKIKYWFDFYLCNLFKRKNTKFGACKRRTLCQPLASELKALPKFINNTLQTSPF
jgi:hypothetical protein